MPYTSKLGRGKGAAKAPFQRGYVGKGSKSGAPECSEAMSVWVRSRNAGQAVSAAIFALLGKCRSMARQKTHAGKLANAGQDLKAQALRSRLDKQGVTGLITAKDRTARAKELLKQRATRQAAAANAAAPSAPAKPAARTAETIRTEQRAKVAAQAKAAPAAKPAPSPARAAAMAKQAAAAGGLSDWARTNLTRGRAILRDGMKSPAAKFPEARQMAARVKERVAARSGKLNLADVQAAANTVPMNLRNGSKVYLHHVWAQYRKTGGKLKLAEFKQQLADSPEARLKLQLGRQDMPQTQRPGNMKAASVTSGTAEFHHMRVSQPGSGERLSRRPIPRVSAETPGKAAQIAAKTRAARTPKPAEHATIGHKPGESFSLATRAASRSSKGPENLGRGSTKFMFDMNKRDLKGQSTIFDKLEAKKPLREPKTARERYNQASRILTRIPKHRLELATRTGTPTSKLYGKNEQVGAREEQLRAARARAAKAMDSSLRKIAREKVDKPETVSTQKAQMAAAVKAVSQIKRAPGKLGAPAAKKAAKPAKPKKLTRSDYKIMAGSALRQYGHATRTGDLIGAQHWLEHHKILAAAAKGKTYAKKGGWNLAPASERSAAAALVAKTRAAKLAPVGGLSNTTLPSPPGAGPKRRGPGPSSTRAEAAVQAPRRLSPREVLAKQRSSTASKVKTYRAEHLEQAEPHKYGKPGKTYDMGTEHVHFDPERFQYKLGAQGKHGVGTALGDVKKWDPELAGAVSVWRDPANGKTYVVNGHHRLDLANKLGVKQVTAKYLDAPDAATARAKGAMTNIAEGRGTPLDAAKFFRDSGLTPEQASAKGISLREHTSSQGLAMAGLSDPLFKRVVNGELSHNRAAIIGGGGLSHEQQHALAKVLDKPANKKLTDGTVKNLVDSARAAGSRKTETRDLFGSTEHEESLFIHRAQVEDSIKRGLAADKRLFGRVSNSKAAQQLEERGGSHVDIGKTGEVATDADRVNQFFDQLKHRDPRISKPLNHAAERIANGEDKSKVTAETRGEVSAVIREILEGKREAFAS